MIAGFEHLQHTVSESQVGRAAVGVARAVRAAWLSSLVSQGMVWAGRLQSSGPAGRLRLCALTVAWAAVGHLAILAVVPAYVAPALPRSAVALVAAAALVVAALAEGFGRAWPGSRVRKALQSSDA